MTLFRHVVGDREVVGPLMEDRPVGSHCSPSVVGENIGLFKLLLPTTRCISWVGTDLG
jgi:hypothetical protein